MKTQSANTYGQPLIGCYLDQANCNSTEHDVATIRLAESLGYTLPDEDRKLVLRAELDCMSNDRDDHSCLSEAADDAIAWLNDQETRSFLYWANSGEAGAFGLWPNVEGAQEDCGFVSSREQEFPPADFTGEWLHVNDHGNATLYVRQEDGSDVEVWSVV